MSIKKIVLSELTATLAMLKAVAAPNVEITEAWQANPGSGVVNFTYKVSDLGGNTCDLLIKVGAMGATSKVITYEAISEGVMTTNINYKQLLGKAYPNVSLSARLDGYKPNVSSSGGVQLWQDGPYWAECNVGATKPEETGYYFWWGDTVGYKRNASDNRWVSVLDSRSISFSPQDCPDIAWLQGNGYIDSTGNLVAAHDAAAAYLGAPWRMPKRDEIYALIYNCDWMWKTQDGMKGYLIKGRGDYASKSIFLPAAGEGFDTLLYYHNSHGEYWSSTLYSDDSYEDFPWCLDFGLRDFTLRNYSCACYCGMSVRPVRGAETSCTVNFNANGGLCSIGSKMYFLGTALGALPAAIWDGHDFVGWFTTAGGGTEIDADTIVSGNITVYAHWATSSSGGVQLWKDGPYWAECNVGATKPEDPGYYFWWGDVVGYKRNANGDEWISVNDLTSFSFSSGNCPTYIVDSAGLQSDCYIDSTGNLVAAHDAATVYFGAPWRMPTSAEFQALVDNCDWMQATQGGMDGYLIKGRGDYASKSIFLPAAGNGSDSRRINLGSLGYYWSSTCHSSNSRIAWQLDFHSGNFTAQDSRDRYYGQSVRPVR